MSSDAGLIDANILVYAHFQDTEHHTASFSLLEQARSNKLTLYVTPQVIAEFFAVITNARRVSSPYKPEEALEAITQILELPGISMLSIPVDVVNRWTALIRQHPVKGGGIFDVQLVATMLGNGVSHIYTYNRKDFEKFSEIEVLTP